MNNDVAELSLGVIMPARLPSWIKHRYISRSAFSTVITIRDSRVVLVKLAVLDLAGSFARSLTFTSIFNCHILFEMEEIMYTYVFISLEDFCI